MKPLQQGRNRLVLMVLGCLLISLLFVRCETIGPVGGPTPPPASGIVARVLAEGNSVFLTRLNGQKINVPHAGTEVVYSGDNVTTGAASSALVTFENGGFMQLFENTDPDILKDLMDWLRIKISQGAVYFDSQFNKKIEVDCGEASVFFRSVVDIKVPRGRPATITLLSGTVQIALKRAPSRAKTLNVSGQQAVASMTSVDLLPPLSSRELQELTRWRNNFPLIKSRIQRLHIDPSKPPSVPSRIRVVE